MPTPFPGMDPYLEHPALWPDVHNRLITAIADDLTPKVAPRYYIGLERRAYLLKPDDVAFIGRADIAAASHKPAPPNKLHGEGREQYLRKRGNVLLSFTSLVEVDLLRAGRPMPVVHERVRSDYRILVSQGWQRPRAQLYPFNLQHQIPVFPLPLLRQDEAPEVDLGAILHALYDRARLDLRLDYTQPPVPPLSDEDVRWAEQLLAH